MALHMICSLQVECIIIFINKYVDLLLVTMTARFDMLVTVFSWLHQFESWTKANVIQIQLAK